MVDTSELARRQAEVAKAALSSEPRFPEIAERWEAWWKFEADRPLLVGTVARDGVAGEAARKRKPFDLIEQPAEWLTAERARLASTYFLDQCIPHIRVDFGPVLTAAFLGAELQFALEENTSWQHPLSNVYDRDLRVDPENRWFQACIALARITAWDAAGNYLVSLPDLSGAPDILANLRGSEQLLVDLYDRPESVQAILPKLVDAWEFGFGSIMSEITAAGAGSSSWLHAWSNVPYTVPTCDFNAMIGPAHFAEFALPYLEDQARRAGRCLFHLDGNDASRHAQALAASTIDAIQYTPGAGSTGAIPKIPMFRMLQDAGKPIVVICTTAEVPELIARLDPRGTVLFVEDIRDEASAHELEALVS
ncbi:MAG: hypothetical protein ACLFP4_13370 [Spirochaetales bacterium]